MACGRDIICGVQRRNNARKPKIQNRGRFDVWAKGRRVAAIYSPAAFFVPFPKSPEFWALIVLEGMLSSFFNSRLYASAARFGAGTTSRISMLAVPIGVVM